MEPMLPEVSMMSSTSSGVVPQAVADVSAPGVVVPGTPAVAAAPAALGPANNKAIMLATPSHPARRSVVVRLRREVGVASDLLSPIRAAEMPRMTPLRLGPFGDEGRAHRSCSQWTWCLRLPRASSTCGATEGIRTALNRPRWHHHGAGWQQNGTGGALDLCTRPGPEAFPTPGGAAGHGALAASRTQRSSHSAGSHSPPSRNRNAGARCPGPGVRTSRGRRG